MSTLGEDDAFKKFLDLTEELKFAELAEKLMPVPHFDLPPTYNGTTPNSMRVMG